MSESTPTVRDLTGGFDSMELGEVLTKPFSFDRKTAKGIDRVHVVMRVLSHQEMALSRINAANTVARLDEKSLAQHSREDWTRTEEDVEALALALMRANDPKLPWATPDQIRRLQPTEILLLAREYERWSDEISPVLRGMTAEQFEAITEAIEKSQRADPLDFFDWPTVKAYIVTLVSRLSESRMDSSFGTSGVSEPSES